MIITTAIIKGGAGKTTTAAALLQAGAKKGQHGLAIDIDPQANLTRFLGAQSNANGTYSILHGRSAEEAIQHTAQGIDVIAGNADLATEVTGRASGRRLQSAINPIADNYDLILIDTPPQMGELVFNALQAANSLIVPVEADVNSAQGLYHIEEIAGQIKKTNPGLDIAGVIVTRYDARPKINRKLIEIIQTACEDTGTPFLGTIRAGIAIKEAQTLQRSIYDYAPHSKPATDYMALYERLERTGK